MKNILAVGDLGLVVYGKFKNFGPFFDLRIIFSLGDIDLDLEEIIDQVPLDVV